MSRRLALCLIGIWSACSAHGLAAEPLFPLNRSDEAERVTGPVRQLIVSSQETIATLSFSPSGALTQKVTVRRDDPPNAAGETTLYRYDIRGHKTGEYVEGDEGDLVPMRLYAYDDNGRLSADAAYHLCRTFSALHLYTYDPKGQLIADLEYASRRLTRREFQYGAHGSVEQAAIHRNGRLLSLAHYAYDDRGRIAAVVSELPDGAVVSRLYRHDEHGNVIVFAETHPRDPLQDKTEITSYEYDAHGNWTRRTIIRAINPLDEDGQPLEEPVQVIEREIHYAASPPQ
jgi:hypothetical protein